MLIDNKLLKTNKNKVLKTIKNTFNSSLKNLKFLKFQHQFSLKGPYNFLKNICFHVT